MLAAVSGGADSVCLLYILAELSRRGEIGLRAAHIHHGLRETADRDCAFVEQLCAQLGVPCETRRVDVPAHAAADGTGIEETARLLRYRALEELCEAWERSEGPEGPPVKIAAAHHREDQAETVLFRLCRGSRLAGAAGMQPSSGRIIRPLLECTREEIEAYLTSRGASWCEDETNEDTRYARNYLRREILPALTEHINAETGLHLAQFAQEAAETEAYLRQQTEEAMRRCRIGGSPDSSAAADADGAPPAQEIRVGQLLREAPLLQRRVLYALLAEAAGRKKDLTALHVQALQRLCAAGGSGSLDLPYGLRAVKEYDSLRILRGGETDAAAQREAESAGESFLLPLSADRYRMRVLTAEQFCGESGTGSLRTASPPENKYTKWLDYDKIASLPTLRTRLPGDRIGMEPAGGRAEADGCVYKSLARLMIDAKIPASVRDRVVLPASGREILWVPGQRIHAGMKVGAQTRRILEISLRAPQTPSASEQTMEG